MHSGSDFLALPDGAILEVLRSLDARSLLALQQTHSTFSKRAPGGLPLVHQVAKQTLLARCSGDAATATRFR